MQIAVKRSMSTTSGGLRKLLTGGVDIGARSVKVAILDHGHRRAHVVASAVALVAGSRQPSDTRAALRQSWRRALRDAGTTASQIILTDSTGSQDRAKNQVGTFHRSQSVAVGARYLFPEAAAVLDVGTSHLCCLRFPDAALRRDAPTRGELRWGGAPLEALAHRGGVSLDEASAKPEAVAFHVDLAIHATALLEKLAVTGPIVLTGALVLDGRFVGALWDQLMRQPFRVQLLVSRDGVFAAAFGAALLAARRYRRSRLAKSTRDAPN